MTSAQCCIHPCPGDSGQIIISFGTGGYRIMCTVIHCLPLQCLGEAIGVHRFLSPTLSGHFHSQWSWNVKPMRHHLFSFCRMGCHWPWFVTMQINDLCWVQEETQGGIMSFEIDRAIHPIVQFNWRKVLVRSSLSVTPQRNFGMIALNLKFYIRSNTANNIYKLDGKVPETIMSGETLT